MSFIRSKIEGAFNWIFGNPQVPLMERPCRNTRQSSWNAEFRNSLKTEIADYCPSQGEYSKIQLIGPWCDGKSSFFNTISSIYIGYVVHQAPTGMGSTSPTIKYMEYPVITETDNALKFRICDTIGFSRNTRRDMEVDYLLDGNIPHGYKLNHHMLTPQTIGFRQRPSLEDIPQCMCFVIALNRLYILDNHTVLQLKTAMKKSRERDVPIIILLTQIDIFCPEVKEDLSNAYNSIALQESIVRVAGMFDVHENCVVLIKNYDSEYDLDDDIDILALLALRQMLRACADNLRNCRHTADGF